MRPAINLRFLAMIYAAEAALCDIVVTLLLICCLYRMLGKVCAKLKGVEMQLKRTEKVPTNMGSIPRNGSLKGCCNDTCR